MITSAMATGRAQSPGRWGIWGVDLIDDLVGGVEGLHLPLQVAGHAAVAVLVHGGRRTPPPRWAACSGGAPGRSCAGGWGSSCSCRRGGSSGSWGRRRRSGGETCPSGRGRCGRDTPGPTGPRRTTAPPGSWGRCGRQSGGGCAGRAGARWRGWTRRCSLRCR